jgi:hypothetical protein
MYAFLSSFNYPFTPREMDSTRCYSPDQLTKKQVIGLEPICEFFLDRLDKYMSWSARGKFVAMQVILFAFTCRKTSDATTYNLFCIGRHDLNLRLPINQTTWISGLLQLLVVAYWHASISELQQLSLESNTSLMYSHLTSWQGKILHNFFERIYVWCTHDIVPVGRGDPGCHRTIQQMNQFRLWCCLVPPLTSQVVRVVRYITIEWYSVPHVL